MTVESPSIHQTSWQFRFFTIWTGQAFSILGSHLVGFAFVWHLTETTGSATVLTIGTLLNVLPMIIISPIAGALVDRWNRKMIMILFDSITALFTILIAILFYLDIAQIWHIYLAMLIRSACGQFQWAAISASTSLMVPKESLPHIAGANQALQGVVNIIGPALGAFLIAVLPIHGVLSIDVITAFMGIVPLFFFTIPQPVRKFGNTDATQKIKTSVWRDFIEGFQYVLTWKSLMGIILIAMLVNFLINPAFALLPLVITNHFSKGAYELGFINSVYGIGVILGGLALSAWGGFKNRILTSLVALIFAGGGVLAIGLAPSSQFLLAVGGMALFGFFIPMVNGPLFAAMQAKVEPEIQGRVFSLLHAGAGLTSPLGLIIAGPIADLTSNQLWFIVGGIATILTGLVALFKPAILEIGLDPEDNPAH